MRSCRGAVLVEAKSAARPSLPSFGGGAWESPELQTTGTLVSVRSRSPHFAAALLDATFGDPATN